MLNHSFILSINPTLSWFIILLYAAGFGLLVFFKDICNNIHKGYCLKYSFLSSVFGFVIRVILASQNELASVPSPSIFCKILRIFKDRLYFYRSFRLTAKLSRKLMSFHMTPSPTHSLPHYQNSTMWHICYN